jgi:hypothetical protein
LTSQSYCVERTKSYVVSNKLRQHKSLSGDENQWYIVQCVWQLSLFCLWSSCYEVSELWNTPINKKINHAGLLIHHVPQINAMYQIICFRYFKYAHYRCGLVVEHFRLHVYCGATDRWNLWGFCCFIYRRRYGLCGRRNVYNFAAVPKPLDLSLNMQGAFVSWED